MNIKNCIRKTVCLLLVLCIAFSLFGCSAENTQYKKAVQAFKAGEYDAATEIFVGLYDYKDSQEYLEKISQAQKDIEYNKAVFAFDSGDYAEAKKIFASLGEHKDSADYLNKINQQDKDNLISRIESLSSMEDSRDAVDSIRKIILNDDEMCDYVLKNASSNGLSSLIQVFSPGMITTNWDDIGEYLEIVSKNGWKNYPIDNVVLLFEMLRDKYDDDEIRYYNEKLSALGFNIDELPDEIAALSKLNQEDVMAVLWSDLQDKALECAIYNLKNQLKDPNSLEIIRNISLPTIHEADCSYSVYVAIDYTATNSYGGTVRDTYEQTFEGHYKLTGNSYELLD